MADTQEQIAARELIEQHSQKVEDLQYVQTFDEGLFPKLLIERAREWGCPESAFNLQASFNRVLIWQIMDWDLERSPAGHWKPKGGSDLVTLPDRAVERSRNEAPRGILISAGLKALEHLHTNGIDLGHYVRCLRLLPYRMPIAFGDDFKHVSLIVCSAADVVASEDTMDQMKAGKLRREWRTIKLPTGETFFGYTYKGEMSPGRFVPEVPALTPVDEEEI